MNERPYTLTDDEANAIKDVLKSLDESLYARKIVLRVAHDKGITSKKLDELLDSAFQKLGNGRVTAIVDGRRQTDEETDSGRLPTIEELKNTAMDGSRLS